MKAPVRSTAVTALIAVFLTGGMGLIQATTSQAAPGLVPAAEQTWDTTTGGIDVSPGSAGDFAINEMEKGLKVHPNIPAPIEAAKVSPGIEVNAANFGKGIIGSAGVTLGFLGLQSFVDWYTKSFQDQLQADENAKHPVPMNTMALAMSNLLGDRMVDHPMPIDDISVGFGPMGASGVSSMYYASADYLASVATQFYTVASNGATGLNLQPPIDGPHNTAWDGMYAYQVDVTCKDTTSGVTSTIKQIYTGDLYVPVNHPAGQTLTYTANTNCPSGAVVANATTEVPTMGKVIDATISDSWQNTREKARLGGDPTLSPVMKYLSPDAVTRSDPNPTPMNNRSFVTSTKCHQPDGTDKLISKSFDPGVGTITIPSCDDATLPDPAAPGSHATDTEIATAPATGGAPTMLVHTAAPAEPDYPKCDPHVAGSFTCLLQISVDSTICKEGVADCVNWTTLDPARVQCHWGGYIVPTSKCNILERAYNPGGAPYSAPNTDGDPTTGSDPAGNPWVPAVKPVPGTGWDTDWKNKVNLDPAGDPVMNPRPQDGPWVDPAAGTIPDPDWMTKPEGKDWACKHPEMSFLGQAKFWASTATGFKLDNSTAPWSAAQAADYKAAFDTCPKGDGGPPDLNNKLPINMLNTIGALLVIPTSNTCPDWRIKIPDTLHQFSGNAVDQNIVCDSDFMKAIRSSRGVFFVFIALTMLMPLVRSVWRASIPILSVGSK